MEEGLSLSLLRVLTDQEQLNRLRPVMGRFSHRCRNTLNGIKMALYLFQRVTDGSIPDCWADVEQTYQEIESLFDRLQTIYRPMTLTMVRAPIGPLIRDRARSWQTWLRTTGRTVQLEAPDDDLIGDYDPMQLGYGLDTLAAWRAEVGLRRCDPLVSWKVSGGDFEVSWNEVRAAGTTTDPNPDGGPTAEFERTRRADPLALPLLARIIIAHRGHLEFTRGPEFGIILSWPRFPGDQP
jgi:hypothetical protein